MESKARVLLVGSGGVGTIAALNLETGNLATVTAVLRSNFTKVKENGFDIKSSDHGHLHGWRPSHVINSVPDVANDHVPPFDYIVVTTKNIPEQRPNLVSLLTPAVTTGHTVIVLIQNGLNIEQPFFEAFPQNIVLSGISFIGSHEVTAGVIEQFEHEVLGIGAFSNPNLSPLLEEKAAKSFIKIYSAAGKASCSYESNVGKSRWRKLVYNACLNPICAITGLDTGRIRLADDAVSRLVRPAMQEIKLAASRAGSDLSDDIIDVMINMDPLEMFYSPSMLEDVRKGNLIEYENILGEPLKTGIALGVPMPTISLLYSLCKAIQWKNLELKGLLDEQVGK